MKVVMQYAENAQESGTWTALYALLWRRGKVHAVCGNDFLTVTPGVQIRRWRCGRSGESHDAGKGKEDRLRLYRSGKTYNRQRRTR